MFVVNGNNWSPSNTKVIVISPDNKNPELVIQKANISQVAAEPYQANVRTWVTTGAKYPNLIVKIIMNNEIEHVIDLTQVQNQTGWYTSSMTPTQQQAGLNQAVIDIMGWL